MRVICEKISTLRPSRRSAGSSLCSSCILPEERTSASSERATARASCMGGIGHSPFSRSCGWLHSCRILT